MSLALCIKKAGSLLDRGDKNAILLRAKELRAEGVKDADRQAINEILSKVSATEVKPSHKQLKGENRAEANKVITDATAESKKLLKDWEEANPKPKETGESPELEVIAEKHGFTSADHMLQAIR